MSEQQLRRFTRKELAEFNGQGGKPAYVAFAGKIYDVSSSQEWIDGAHCGDLSAGEDLTEMIDAAPHNESLLEKFPIVGELIQ